MAVKQSDLKFEEAALRKRLEFVRSLKDALLQEDSIATVTVNAYSSVIDDIIKEVAQEVHRAVKTGVDTLDDIKSSQQQNNKRQKQQTNDDTPSPTPVAPAAPTTTNTKAAVDMFGNTVQKVSLDQVHCPNCGRSLAAARFAPHLEKCMGRGRNANKVTKRYTDYEHV